MHLIYLAAGAGQMYCGACARDLALVRGLIARGHDAEVIPLYTPLRIEGEAPDGLRPVFLGGLNAFLQQHSSLFRRLPPAADRVLDHPALLRFVSQFAVRTEAARLGPMTVSVLAGREGRQRKELERLMAYLRQSGSGCSASTPNTCQTAFIITNSLLSGLAPELRRNFGAPVLCGLQGEDAFLEALGAPHTEQALAHIRRNARSVDLFIASSADCARRMGETLGLPADDIAVVRTGLDATDFAPLAAGRCPAPPGGPCTIGYLSVITPGKGLDLLVESVARLHQSGRPVRLLVAGRVLNHGYWQQVQRQIARGGLQEIADFRGEVTREGKLQLLRECRIFCLPSRFAEARGVAAMEAMASGLPVVVTAQGVFPELLQGTEAGLQFAVGETGPHGAAEALTACLNKLLDDPARGYRMGQVGARTIATRYSVDVAVTEVLAAVERACSRHRASAD
ncbi:glycosyltransferase family 4 protein [bacterium]|nr:glycosyltransferase family 4 protein [bacterium]